MSKTISSHSPPRSASIRHNLELQTSHHASDREAPLGARALPSLATLYAAVHCKAYTCLPLPTCSILPCGSVTVAVVFGGVITVNECVRPFQSVVTVP